MTRRRPNIVFVFADQMRAQATGYAGDPNAQTPYLDRLSHESLNVANAVANIPVCTPSRACLVSGQYPLTHGLFINDLCLPDNGHSIGQELRRGGYDTAWIGKWHVYGHGRTAPIPSKRRQGFHYWKVLECTHDYQRSQYYVGDETEPRCWEGYDAFAQTDAAVEYVRARAGHDAPFVLFLSFGPPHDPYETAPANLRALYPPAELQLRPNVAPHRRELARSQLVGYYAHVTAIDRCVERLDAAIEETGGRQDTIFVFTSDHGDMLESQWQQGEEQRGPRKQAPYDESVCVPFLLRYPARFGTAGGVVADPVATPDIIPTLLSLAGLPAADTAEGIDVSPALAAKSSLSRDGVLIACYQPFADWRTARGGRPYRGIRTERYTFVCDLNGPWLMFDNRDDPYQLDNLVNRAVTAQLQRQLDSQLGGILEAQGDAFEAPEALLQRWGYAVGDDGAIPYS